MAAAAVGVSVGVLGLAAAVPRRRPDPGAAGRRSRRGPRPERTRAVLAAAAPAAAVGVGAAVLTGWPVALVIAAVAAYGLPRLLRRTAQTASIARIEAVATWTEMLQGTLAASAGLSQALIATAGLSPAPLRQATERLAAELRAGVPPPRALLGFAEEVADPGADRVVCALLLAFQARAQRLGDLLGALAASTRDDVSLRLRVETGRASVRSGVRTVVVFSVAFAAGLAVLARPYLAPYGSPTGQLVLLVVAGLYGVGLTAMVALARPPAGVRLLGPGVAAR